MISEIYVLIFSLLGGILPALFWLLFWIREDRLKPEPKLTLLSAFLGGIIAVIISFFFELLIYYLIIDAKTEIISNFPTMLNNTLQWLAERLNLIKVQEGFYKNIKELFLRINSYNINVGDIKKMMLVVVVAPIIEEISKLIITYNICLKRKTNDEPIDASIYMITTALGFAAIETSIFLITPFSNNNFLDGLSSVNMRAIGPMLIHIISSAILGIFIGLAFYKSKIKKIIYLLLGLILAILIHSSFNFFMILKDINNDIKYFLFACLSTWIFMIILLLLFKKIKKIKIQ